MCHVIPHLQSAAPGSALVTLLNNQVRKPKLVNMREEESKNGEDAPEACSSPEKGLHMWSWEHGCTRRGSLSWKYCSFWQHCAMDSAPSRMLLGIEVRLHIYIIPPV